MEQWKPQVFPCSHKSFLTPDAEISGIGKDIRTLASRKAQKYYLGTINPIEISLK